MGRKLDKWTSILNLNIRNIKNRTNHTIPEIGELLSIDPYKSDIEDIGKSIRCLNKQEQEQLFTLCKKCINDKNILKDKSTRIATVKILINLLPASTSVIKDIINKKEDRYDYELHCTLFCFLDSVPSSPGGDKFAREIPSIIERYLMEIKTETAYAAFMAGDLLGDHWDVNESLPILVKLANKARYSVGRDSAIHGLGHLLQQLSNDSPQKEKVISLIRDVAKNDRSKQVRITAQFIIGGKTI